MRINDSMGTSADDRMPPLEATVLDLRFLIRRIIEDGLEDARRGRPMNVRKALAGAEARMPTVFRASLEVRSPAVAAVEDAIDRCYGAEQHDPPPLLPDREWVDTQIDEIIEPLLGAWADFGIMVRDAGIMIDGIEPERAEQIAFYTGFNGGIPEARTGWLTDPGSDGKVQIRAHRAGRRVVIAMRRRGEERFHTIAEHGVEHARHIARLLDWLTGRSNTLPM